MSNLKRLISLVLILSMSWLGFVQCYGGFALTKKLHGWVGSLGNKWISWIVFLVFVFFPVYGICILADALIFNSIEFWSGNNVIGLNFDENGEHKKVVEKGDEKAVLLYRQFGRRLDITIYKRGDKVQQLVLKKDLPGKFFTPGARGELEELQLETRDQNESKILRLITRSGVVAEKSMSRAEFYAMSHKAEMTARGIQDKGRMYATGKENTPAATTDDESFVY